ncbi:MliC family protein [Tamlana sp. I1]|uniref:MliC family protein n=1 Tax=Tamlana sp. I1 TaxID=2762061 RepID=UPI00188E8489|nr:MliC family protein [Tamlana sp. I1]
MKSQAYLLYLFIGFSLNTCVFHEKEATETTQSQILEKATDEIVTSKVLDKNGNVLEMFFNNTKGYVILKFEGKTLKLQRLRTGSGIWYKNTLYELRGKGKHLELTKGTETVFKS